MNINQLIRLLQAVKSLCNDPKQKKVINSTIKELQAESGKISNGSVIFKKSLAYKITGLISAFCIMLAEHKLATEAIALIEELIKQLRHLF